MNLDVFDALREAGVNDDILNRLAMMCDLRQGSPSGVLQEAIGLYTLMYEQTQVLGKTLILKDGDDIEIMQLNFAPRGGE